MKRLLSICLTMFCLATFAADEPSETSLKLESEAERVGYALGMQVGMQIQQMLSMGGPDTEISQAAVLQAIQDALTSGEMAMTTEDAMGVLQAFSQKMQAQMQQDAPQMEDGAEAGQAYLAENAAKEDVTVTESGLQYEVLEKGDGAKPKATDTVTVHYTGKLIDGTVFDSSVERGQPATFPLNGVIPGWTEGVQLMNVDSKYRFVIPSDLAYGEQGAPPRIPPNSTLIFDVELLEIK